MQFSNIVLAVMAIAIYPAIALPQGMKSDAIFSLKSNNFKRPRQQKMSLRPTPRATAQPTMNPICHSLRVWTVCYVSFRKVLRELCLSICLVGRAQQVSEVG